MLTINMFALLLEAYVKVKDILREAAYAGNLGMMEVARFYMQATEEQKAEFKRLVAQKLNRAAWKLVYSVIGGPRLQGDEFKTD